MSLWSFRRLHPDWDIALYFSPSAPKPRTWITGHERHEFEHEPCGPCYLKRAVESGVRLVEWNAPSMLTANLSPVHQNDICRWKCLSQHGGWFADLDILFVDSLETIHDAANADAADVVLTVGREGIPTGMIGGTAGAPFWADCLNMAVSKADARRYRSCGSEVLSQLAQIEKMPVFDRKLARIGLERAAARGGKRPYFYKPQCFYLFDEYRLTDILHYSHEVLSNTVGIHWFAGSKLAQKLIREADEKNFAGRSGTFFDYARDLSGIAFREPENDAEYLAGKVSS